jgi:hypothetical protein
MKNGWDDVFTNTAICQDCGKEFEEKETIFLQSINRCVCLSCYEQNYFCCNECGYISEYDTWFEKVHNNKCPYCTDKETIIYTIDEEFYAELRKLKDKYLVIFKAPGKETFFEEIEIYDGFTEEDAEEIFNIIIEEKTGYV